MSEDLPPSKDQPVRPARRPVRVCLDLNVWVADLLGARLGHTGTACQALVAAVRRGRSSLGPVQLVVSWGMLTRLREVLEDKLHVRREAADPYLAAIVGYARLGPAGDLPYVVLGGAGVMPLRDAEDAHVLDVALAAGADYLVTANFDDFVTYRTTILAPGRIAAVPDAGGRLLVAHPFDAAGWLRGGRVTLPDPLEPPPTE